MLASGGLPILEGLRTGELVATLALAQDNAFGQPLESQLRSCLLATWLAEEAGLDEEQRRCVYWVALLRYIGCTAHAHEVATLFGDEIAIRAQTLVHDAGDPAEVMRDVVEFATAGKSAAERRQIVEAIHAGAHDWAVHNFASGCEAGDMLVEQLGFAADVREALGHTFERWNGAGFPHGAAGSDIPVAMLVVHISHDMEAIGRRFSPARALEAVRARSGRTYEPGLAALFADHGAGWFERLADLEPWDTVLDLEPAPRRVLRRGDLDESLTVVADFIDLKSPYMHGHSRRCATLAGDAAAMLGLAEPEVARVRRAALVHELGTTAISNAILDKPSSLSRAERDRVEIHPLLTEQMLRRSPALAVLRSVAATHHERADGSGYHRGLAGSEVEVGGRALAAADVFVGLTTERADRPAAGVEDATAALRDLADRGSLDPPAVEAVLATVGQSSVAEVDRRRRELPAGLTAREVEVLRLAARGRTTAAIAERLHISPKTADHHIQHIYTKIGVSTRAAAAVWAMRHDLVG